MSTHQQLLFHIVFSTKSRKRLLSDAIRDDVFAYMAGICKNLEGYALDIGGFYDHAHLLLRIPAKVAVSNLDWGRSIDRGLMASAEDMSALRA